MSTTIAVARHQLRILRNDPWFLIIMFLMPLALMPLMREALGINLQAVGFEGASGAEQVVPGQTIMFGFFVAGNVAFALFREHGWRTWDRIRASAAAPASLLAGFMIPSIAIHLVYQAVLLTTGSLFFGLRFNGGSPIALLLIMASFSFCAVSFVLVLAASLRTINQVNALVNVGAMVFGGVGGALVPFEQLPGWARAVGPFTPHYWAMEGNRSVFLEEGGIGDVIVGVAIMTAIGIAACVVGVWRFRTDETKEFFA
ncbi:MAG: ABC transporter permease [Actinomycetota bacterium]